MRQKVIIQLIVCFFFHVMMSEARTARYRAMWRQNPATTMVIGWDQVSGSNPTLFYDVRDHGKSTSQYAFSSKPDKILNGKGMNNHFVRLTGLKPNTIYYFIIRDSEGTSRRMSFQTAPDLPTHPLSIIAGGDSRNHRDARIRANRLVSKLRPHCVMFSGDMTERDNSEQWVQWFDDWQKTIGSDGRLFPIIVTRGNHESSNETLVKLFDIKNPDLYYALNLGGSLVRIYTLNSNIPSGGQQRIWLANDLEANENTTWKFAQYHNTMRPHCSTKDEQNQLIVDWATLFHKYGVNLAVESDAHVVKWTYPIRPSRAPGSEEGFIRDDRNGTVYVGEGCWGAPLRESDDPKSWTRDRGSFNQFKLIFVNMEKVEIRTLKTDLVDQVGEVDPYDVFAFPSGLRSILWQPRNGSTITLQNYNYTGPPLLYAQGKTRPQQSQGNRTPSAKQPRMLSPNPATGDVTLHYTIKSAAEVSLILTDEQENEVSRFRIGRHTPGQYTKSINFKQISRGRYILMIATNNSIIKKFNIDNQ